MPKLAVVATTATALPAMLSTVTSVLLASVSALSALLGSCHAYLQRPVSRWLAYSGTAHLAYVLAALSAATATSHAVALAYVAVYTLSNVAAILFLATHARSPSSSAPASTAPVNSAHDLANQCNIPHSTARSLAMSMALISMAGLPPLAGFVAKCSVFAVLISSSQWWLLSVLVLSGLLAALVYARAVK